MATILMHGWVYDANEIDTGDVRYLSTIELRKLVGMRPSLLRTGVARAAQAELKRRTRTQRQGGH